MPKIIVTASEGEKLLCYVQTTTPGVDGAEDTIVQRDAVSFASETRVFDVAMDEYLVIVPQEV